MTPREKEIELIQKYNLVVLDTALGGSNQRVKQCALIAVDEIEKAERNVLLKFNLVNEDMVMHYWQLVKQEIEKL